MVPTYSFTNIIKMNVVGFVGRKGVGRKECAQFLCEYFINVRVLSYASPIKEASKHAYLLSDDQLEENKDVYDERWDLTPRDIMRNVGNTFRFIDEDHWIHHLNMRFDQVEKDNVTHVAISDVRFETEAKSIKEIGGILVHVGKRIDGEGDDHISETESDDIECNYYIQNNGSLEDLKRQCDAIFNNIR